jgi:hypothetical protein
MGIEDGSGFPEPCGVGLLVLDVLRSAAASIGKVARLSRTRNSMPS